MIQKLSASVTKEILLLLRDKTGLAVLFIMPMVLIFVMTLIQDSAFRSMNENGIPVVFVNEDMDSLGFSIQRGLQDNPLCRINNRNPNIVYSAEQANQVVSKGEYILGIIVPANATKSIRNHVKKMVENVLNPEASANDSASEMVEIKILIDPVANKSFVNSIVSNIREFISELKMQLMFETFSNEMSQFLPSDTEKPDNNYKQTQIVKFQEEYATNKAEEIKPNAVQHNVPAWSVFAVFFIVLPLTAGIVKEKSEGSIFRIYTMPTPYSLILTGKILVYVVICLIQFILMFCVGLFLLPLLGLPILNMGESVAGIFLICIASAFAATGFGVMVGTLARTEPQGAIMGSLSVLLLSALGGIWVPSYIMPDFMQKISAFSPLNWGLAGFYELFLRNGGFTNVVLPALKLFIFFILTISIAIFYNKYKRSS
jgi:ABC-2 type transport system permease protein